MGGKTAFIPYIKNEFVNSSHWALQEDFMKNILKVTTISVLALALIGGAGYWFIQNFSGSDGEDIAAIAEEIDGRGASAETDAAAAAETEEKAGEKAADMEEGKLQTYLHQMTHQKIVADKKRGALEMSPENIGNMLKIVRENKDLYRHGDFYEETLTAWENGDFSNAVTVHNTIWNWHNGTVGRATGLMSAEQEAEYVEKNFR